MLFNSLGFAIFLPVVFILYWFVANKDLKRQNLLLLVASYYFYSCWDWRFVFLLVFSTLLDYFTGIKMEEGRRKKFWLLLSVILNLGFLGVFKYYNFFATSFTELALGFGLKLNPGTLEVILPLGISFYTFHGLSYVFDIYYGRIRAERNFVDYSVFVSFFPLLVAGPIERATHLLPQIKRQRTFDYVRAVDGMKQILWGLFKKIVIADRCAEYANTMFTHTSDYSGSSLIVGALFFSIQIYCDFSGYSDIALGTARLFGIELLRNFAFPYFSRDIAEFWRRWHMSLSSWFRDYLYIPLGGNTGGTWKRIRNVFIIFLVSGFWHGANWTFIAWGFLNALYILPLVLSRSNRNNLGIVAAGKIFPSLREFASMAFTFGLTVLAWIFFRATSIEHALTYISRIFTGDLLSFPAIDPKYFVSTMLLIMLFMITEWIGRDQQYAIARFGNGLARPARWALYVTFTLMIYYLGKFEGNSFIYFQF